MCAKFVVTKQVFVLDGRQGGTESADDPISQNSEHSGARLLPNSMSRRDGATGNGYAEFSASETSSGDDDSEEEDNEEIGVFNREGKEGRARLTQVQESDHRTSSEMIADLMDSEEKMRSVLKIFIYGGFCR